jgi:hypothetical protein
VKFKRFWRYLKLRRLRRIYYKEVQEFNLNSSVDYILDTLEQLYGKECIKTMSECVESGNCYLEIVFYGKVFRSYTLLIPDAFIEIGEEIYKYKRSKFLRENI